MSLKDNQFKVDFVVWFNWGFFEALFDLFVATGISCLTFFIRPTDLDPRFVLRRLLVLRGEIGPFGTLILTAHDWDDRDRWLRSHDSLAKSPRC